MSFSTPLSPEDNSFPKSHVASCLKLTCSQWLPALFVLAWTWIYYIAFHTQPWLSTWCLWFHCRSPSRRIPGGQWDLLHLPPDPQQPAAWDGEPAAEGSSQFTGTDSLIPNIWLRGSIRIFHLTDNLVIIIIGLFFQLYRRAFHFHKQEKFQYTQQKNAFLRPYRGKRLKGKKLKSVTCLL